MRPRSSVSLLVVLALMVPALAAAAGPKEKVDVCHIPPGNPGNAHTITVNGNALKAHLAHGDTEGECREERPGKVDDDDDSSDDKTSENRAPIARAGTDRCVLFGASYELDGTDSYDLDGDALDFDWDVINRPAGSDLDDNDLSPDDDDDDPTFTPDRLGNYRFALTVEDPDGASDTDVVDVDVYIDVELDDTEYDVDEDDTVAVEITLSDEAPQDVVVALSVDDDVVVFVSNANDDESDEITSVTIDAGDDDVTVYLYGLEDSDDLDESTDITVSVGSNDCGASDTASVDVEDDDEKVESFAATRSLQLFVLRVQQFMVL
ncbi:MAG: PKD domain-containing protein [Acidimicrobiia bacterium]|nr:PKD domain-containing protein [Acidimicrobiia bacterium]